MINENNIRPDNLSDEEWAILEHIAALGSTFYMADALLEFKKPGASDQLRNTILLTKSFEHLKTAGYLKIQPMAFADVTQSTRPLYALSALGKKAINR